MAVLNHDELQKLHAGHYNTEVDLFVEYPITFDDGRREWLAACQIDCRGVGDLVLLELLAGLCSGAGQIAPRGLPSDLSEVVFSAAHYEVVARKDVERLSGTRFLFDDSPQVKRWGGEKLVKESPGGMGSSGMGFALDPEIFSPSHLSYEELTGLFEEHDLEPVKVDPLIEGMMALLESLHRGYGASRLTFWFRS